MGPADRIGAALRHSLHDLPVDAAAKVRALLTPTALTAVAFTRVVRAGSQALGVGEAVDLLLLGAGLVLLGKDAVAAVHHFGRFVKGNGVRSCLLSLCVQGIGQRSLSK
jgi:hypothetical protein